MVATGLLLVMLGLAASTADAGPDRPLAFVSFNMFHGGPASGLTGETADLDRRLRMVVRELKALDVDVIGLQEVSASRRRGNIAGRLARELGYHEAHALGVSTVVPFAWLGRTVVWLLDFDEGPAVVSRFPIVAREALRLPRCGRYWIPRMLLRTELDTPAGRVHVFSTHTSHDACQVRAVAEAVQRFRGRLPSIVMGDFNASDSAPFMVDLRRGMGFVDAYRAANPAAPGHTVWQRISAPTATVGRRVDYVFVVPGTEAAGRVLASEVVLDTPERTDRGTLWPSDHYGVLARVDVAAPAATARASSASHPGPGRP
jgi:endonuclease/exonuclease/phosphatase family metal-dependent hydrolase